MNRRIKAYTKTAVTSLFRELRGADPKMSGRPRDIPVSDETKIKRLASFNETIAKRNRKFREALIAKIQATPGIRTTEVTDGRNVNLKLITVMAKEKEIIRKIPRTGNGYELYLPEMRKENGT